jgi:hypothetical protein
MLEALAIANIAVSIALMLWSIMDVNRRPLPMRVMQWVWPLTFLWGGLFALAMYLWFGRAPPPDVSDEPGQGQGHGRRPMWQSVALGATHCGAGCSLADLLVEGGMHMLGLGFVFLGHKIFGNWIIDYAAALVIGVVFQYAALAPMSHEPFTTVTWKAFKSDVLSLSSWQVGMYGWMAIGVFVLFGPAPMEPDRWLFWWMMQVAMLCGFITAYPVNWLLIHSGVKEAM